MQHIADKLPWYRQPLVWMLILLPATVVVASFISLYLAIRSDDGLVEDDYYQHGQEINRVLDRDHAAQRYGLAGEVSLASTPGVVVVQVRAAATAPASGVMPERLELKLLHATRAGLDRSVSLVRMSDGQYQGPLPALAQGHWYLQLTGADWRLTGELHVPGKSTVTLTAR
jgi:hypothetical protein